MDIEERAKQLAEEEQQKAQAIVVNNEDVLSSPPQNIVQQNEQVDNAKLQEIQNKFLDKQVNSGKTLNEITTDFAHASITNAIFNDETKDAQKFKDRLAKEKQEELAQAFKKEKYKSQSQSIDEKHKKAEALYKSFRPILEFDFSNLIKNGKDKDSKAEQKEITYADRSYGIAMMSIMLFFLTIPYVMFTIFLALFNGVNAIFEMINTFGKCARGVGLTIFFIMLGVLIIYLILLGLQVIFGVNLIGIVQSWF